VTPAIALVVSLAIGVWFAQTPIAPSLQNIEAEASVTRAVTGDALDARVNGMRTALGYVGVSAPSPAEPCGAEALARNQELAADHVWLESDPAYEFDARGLRLYYAYTSDGISIEETLIREGFARAERTDGIYGAYLAQLQADAEASGIGCLWGGGAPPPPPHE